MTGDRLRRGRLGPLSGSAVAAWVSLCCSACDSASDGETAIAPSTPADNNSDSGSGNAGSGGAPPATPATPAPDDPAKEPEAGTQTGNELRDSSAAEVTADAGKVDEPPVATASGLAAFSDDFADKQRSASWQVLNAPMFTWDVSDGQLEMRPLNAACDVAPYCVWFQADQGPALYKLIQGNFMVTSRVHARSATTPTQPPASPYLFAGLIARDPRSDNGPENYVFTVVGHRDHLTNELKNTVDDNSRVSETGERTNADLDLRICRIGQRFMLLNREIDGDTWVETQRYDRTEQPMSTTLQVGPIAYNYATPADVIGQFEHVTFTEIATFADCAGN